MLLPAEHPLLRRVARPSERRDRRLERRLIATMRRAGGVGIAAPQIGVSLAVCVIEMDGQAEVCYDPRVSDAAGSVEDVETCLSLPGHWVVERAERVYLQWTDRSGRPRERWLGGWSARIAQHEVDHLAGTMIDRLGAPLDEAARRYVEIDAVDERRRSDG